MRNLLLSLLLVVVSSTALAAKKTTVAELNKTIATLVTDHRSDEEIANSLADIELTEQLTPAALETLVKKSPGIKTTEKLLLFSVESSLLLPPSWDLPPASPPDAAAQAALLQRAQKIAQDAFLSLPKLHADKETLRFQNGLAYIKNLSGNGLEAGVGGGAYEEPQDRAYPVLIENKTVPVLIEAGTEQSSGPLKQQQPGGPLGQISQVPPGLPLLTILQDLAAAQPTWVRWQLIGGQKTAVFTFAVSKKKSPYKINYCCFPEMEHVGSDMHFSANTGTLTTFHPYKTSAGYHAEIYIDAATGLIVRVVTYAEPKKTDFVPQEDLRVDYVPVQVAGKTYIVPDHSTLLTTVVPNGDAYVQFTTRRTLFDITYKNYRP